MMNAETIIVVVLAALVAIGIASLITKTNFYKLADVPPPRKEVRGKFDPSKYFVEDETPTETAVKSEVWTAEQAEEPC